MDGSSPEIKAKKHQSTAQRRASRRSYGELPPANVFFDGELVPNAMTKEGDTHGFSKFLYVLPACGLKID